jgi:hypothetical protein
MAVFPAVYVIAAMIQAIPIPRNTQNVFAGASRSATVSNEIPDISAKIEKTMMAFNITAAVI